MIFNHALNGICLLHVEPQSAYSLLFTIPVVAMTSLRLKLRRSYAHNKCYESEKALSIILMSGKHWIYTCSMLSHTDWNQILFKINCTLLISNQFKSDLFSSCNRIHIFCNHLSWMELDRLLLGGFSLRYSWYMKCNQGSAVAVTDYAFKGFSGTVCETNTFAT